MRPPKKRTLLANEGDDGGDDVGEGFRRGFSFVLFVVASESDSLISILSASAISGPRRSLLVQENALQDLRLLWPSLSLMIFCCCCGSLVVDSWW